MASEASIAPVDTVAALERRLARERERRQVLEQLLEDRTRSLYLAQEELRESTRFLSSVLGSISSAVVITDSDGFITNIGGTTSALTGFGDAELVGRPMSDIVNLADVEPSRGYVRTPSGGPADPSGDRAAGVRTTQGEGHLVTAAGQLVPVLITLAPLEHEDGHGSGAVLLATDISERRRMELELRHAHRLESIGQLAAGVAHEINTPIQYVGDSLVFLGDAMTDLLDLHEEHQRLRTLMAGCDLSAAAGELLAGISAKEDAADIEFLREESPKAIARTVEGIGRVASIVRAMKQFSHPATETHAPVALNDLIETTLTVARNEYRYVADVTLDLGEVPDVVCNRGDIGQVLINLIVNAAHAISDVTTGTDDRGAITIRSFVDDVGAVVEIEDTGGGIPEGIRDRVFDPFFTTKDPGRGTGQGLSLVHNLVVGKHRGQLSFSVEPGVGTTFRVWLPLTEV